MSQLLVTNNHLLEKIEEVNLFLEEDKEVPLELANELMWELKVSNLIIPAIEQEEYLTFEHVTSEEDITCIPLFSDVDEFKKHVSDEEFNAITLDFDVYVDLVNENEFDGIVINMDGDQFILDSEFLDNIYFEEEIFSEDTEMLAPEQLKEEFENAENASLVEFIRDEDHMGDTERLYVELSNASLLNLVVWDKPLDDFAKDGIISADDVEGFSLCTVEDDEVRLGAVFTGKDAFDAAINKDSGLYYYGQLTVLSELFDFVLRNDMDGVVVNPNSDDYIILREDILPQASGIEIIVERPEAANSLDYAFLL